MNSALKSISQRRRHYRMMSKNASWRTPRRYEKGRVAQLECRSSCDPIVTDRTRAPVHGDGVSRGSRLGAIPGRRKFTRQRPASGKADRSRSARISPRGCGEGGVFCVRNCDGRRASLFDHSGTPICRLSLTWSVGQLNQTLRVADVRFKQPDCRSPCELHFIPDHDNFDERPPRMIGGCTAGLPWLNYRRCRPRPRHFRRRGRRRIPRCSRKSRSYSC